MGEFSEVYHHRLRYFLTPQFDMYRYARELLEQTGRERLKVLDYGCGNGVGSVLLKTRSWEVTGVDSDEEAVAFAKDSWGHLCSFRHEDWAGENVEVEEFDAIVCLEVIEHVADPSKLLASLRRSVDGYRRTELILSTLNHNSQYRKNRGHIGRFCLADFGAMVRDYFPGARITDYTMQNDLEPGSSITPMVAVWNSRMEP